MARRQLVRTIALLGVVLSWLLALPAVAAELRAPAGWRQGDAVSMEARMRAKTWARQWGGGVRDIASTTDDDGLVETLALIELDTPLPKEALKEPTAATEWLQATVSAQRVEPVVFEAVTLVPTDAPDTAIISGSTLLGPQRLYVAAGPRGPRTLVIALLINDADRVLYDDVFDSAKQSLTDLSPPISAFPISAVTPIALLVWLLVTLGLVLGWVERTPPATRVRNARLLALVALGGAIVVIVACGTLLDSNDPSLALAQVSTWRVGVHAALPAPMVALALAIYSRSIAGKSGPVASAPSKGSFAASRSRVAPVVSDSDASTAARRPPMSPPAVAEPKPEPIDLPPPGAVQEISEEADTGVVSVPLPNASPSDPDIIARPPIAGIADLVLDEPDEADAPASLVDAHEQPKG